MKEMPGRIESWITVKSTDSVSSLLEAQRTDTPKEVEVIDPKQLDGRGQLRFNMRGGVSGRWDGGKPDETSMLHFAIEVDEYPELYRLYYLTNRFGESLGMIHVTEHGGKVPDDYGAAREQLQRILREDMTEQRWEPCLIEFPD